MREKTHISGKKHIYTERDLHAWKKTYIFGNRPMYTEKDFRKEICRD